MTQICTQIGANKELFKRPRMGDHTGFFALKKVEMVHDFGLLLRESIGKSRAKMGMLPKKREMVTKYDGQWEIRIE